LASFGSPAPIDGDLVEWGYGEHGGRLTVDIWKERPDWQLFRDGRPRERNQFANDEVTP